MAIKKVNKWLISYSVQYGVYTVGKSFETSLETNASILDAAKAHATETAPIGDKWELTKTVTKAPMEPKHIYITLAVKL